MKLILALSLLAITARADWPTYLHDMSRVGHTVESVTLPLALRSTFESPTPPQMAWSGEDGKRFETMILKNRVTFDDVFHIAIAGENLFFGSSVDGRIHCQNLSDGQDVWTFFTDAPVRLAPMVADGRVFIGSDDGWVYCLSAKDGSVVWKLRAGPNDERILARGRMISRWPVRTGVLVDDGIAYFGAGVFPHENVYLYAVEAATGKVIWRNDSISQQDAGRNDLSPQGYLLATKDLLFVPSGRTLAASFNRKTGEYLVKPEPGWRGDAGGQIGGTQAFLADDQIFAVGEHQILALDQDKQKTGFGWFAGTQMTLAGDMGYMANGKQIIAIDRLAHAEGTRKLHALQTKITKLTADLKKHPALALVKDVQKAESTLRKAKEGTDQAAIASAEKALATVAAKYEPKRVDYKAKQDELAQAKKDVPGIGEQGVKWKFETPIEHASSLILAGKTLFAGGKDEVIAIDTETGAAPWSAKVEGEVRGLAFASGHLVVSTTTGKIYNFGSGAATTPEAPKLAQLPTDVEVAAKAEAIIKQTGVTKGFCIVLGNNKGHLAYELAKRSELVIFGVDTDAKRVEAARNEMINTGLYGPRLTFDHLDLSTIPYGSYFANLIVSDADEPSGIPEDVARHLKPLGGILMLKSSAKTDAFLAATKLTDEKATITKSGEWTILKRAALPGAGDWSHQYGNAANTAANNDQRVKGGLSVLWYGDPGPGKMVNRHVGAVGPLSVNGRLFIQGDETVMAYDAYNGQQLWEVPNPGAMRGGVFNAREPGNMAANDDALFMLIEEKCVQFNAATGKVEHEFIAPGTNGDKTLQWGYIAYQDGLLFGTVTKRPENAAELAHRGAKLEESTDTVFAFDVKSQKLAWNYQGKHIAHQTVAIGDGRVYFVDASLTQTQREEMLRTDKSELAKLTGEAQKIAEERQKKADLRLAVGLDLKTGKQVFSKPVDVTDCSEIGTGGGALTLMFSNGHLVLCGANANGHYWQQFIEGEFKRRRIVVLDGNNGEKIWAKDANYRSRPVVIGNDIIAEPWSYDLYTGQQKMRTHPITGEQEPWTFIRPGHHCGVISATPNMMFFRSKFTAFYNRDEDQGTEHFAGQRLGCWINTIPANGLVMIPEASAGCVCLFSIASTIVFEPREHKMTWGVYHAEGATLPVQHMALNLGAPGDRRDSHGKLWLGYPRPSSRAGIDLPLNLKPTYVTKEGGAYAFNEETVKIDGAETPWVFTSGLRGVTHLELPLIGKDQKPATYTVRLSFAALENDKPGQRVFDVSLQGKTVLKSFDPVVAAGAVKKAHVAEFEKVNVTDNLVLDITTTATDTDHMPVISGIEVVRTGAKEILEVAKK
jgi:outer membrane protein assembly factor BamB